MFDRLLSAAGAVADVVDRFVRRFLRLGGGGPIIVALALAFVAAASLFAGIEATGNPNPQVIAPAAVAGTADFGLRTYSTISGGAFISYVETYRDDNDNGKKDPEETARSWFYWVLDEATRTGVTVRSNRTPDEIFHYQATGTVQRSSSYVAEDLTQFKGEISSKGLTFDPAIVIDASVEAGGSPAPYDWAAAPADGTGVTIAGTLLGSLSICSADPNADGQCTPDEADAWDVLLYDGATRTGVVVYVEKAPTFFPATFTGMLRRDAKVVGEAQHPDEPGFDFSKLGITVSRDYYLEDGARPASAPLAFGAALLLGLLAAVILVGLRVGYIVFRGAPQPLPSRARSLAIGERIPVKVSGTLVTPAGPLRVREAAADLVRIELPREAPPPVAAPADAGMTAQPATETGPAAGTGNPLEPPPPAGPPPSTLIVERRDHAAGIAVGRGEIAELSVGRVIPFSGARPGIRLVGGTGRLYLSFDTVSDRDRATAELLDEGDLSGGLAGVAKAAPSTSWATPAR